MKILHVITCIDDAGGAEKLMGDLLPGLKHEGFDVSCLVFYGFNSRNRTFIEKEGVKVYELSRNNHYYNPIKLFKLIPYVRNFDVIHAHNTPAVIFVALANFLGKANLVMTVHNTDGKMRHIWILRSFDRWIHKRYKRIICCSQSAENSLRQYLKTNIKICTINNGIILKRYVEATPLIGLKCEECKAIVMVAWFRAQKNHKVVIEALKLLPFSFHVFFVGAGEKLEECVDYAKQLGISDRTHFLGLRTDVPAILKTSDYIVLSSHYEGLSLSSIEGMCAGKPFLASDVDGLREIVGGAGLLFPDGDAKKLADSIMELDRNPDLYRDVASRCYERAMQYDISSMINGYKEIYDKIKKEYENKGFRNR